VRASEGGREGKGEEDEETYSDVLVPNADDGKLLRRVLCSDFGEMREDGSAWRTCREEEEEREGSVIREERTKLTIAFRPSIPPSVEAREVPSHRLCSATLLSSILLRRG